MPHIVPLKYETKKSLKDAILAGANIYFHDPAYYAPRSYSTHEMQPGDIVTCTNHPKRSWFARVERLENGWKIT